MLSLSKLKEALTLLNGKECWSVVAGAGPGSDIHLEFGAKIPPRVPLRERSRLTAEQARYEGELDLFIQCAWRLESAQSVLCGSTDDDRNDGPMVQGLAALKGRTVRGIEVADPIPDFELHFDGDLRLKVFCDQTNVETNDDNFSLRLGETIYAVAARGHLAIEKRISQ